MAKDDEKEVVGDEKKKGGKLKLIIMVVPVILLIAAGAYFFLLRPKSDSGPVALPEPTPGTVVTLDPITINLAGAHFLKLGIALQPIKAATEVNGSKALDLAISQFSGETIDDLSTEKGREQAKNELVARVKLAYLPEGTDFAVATGQESAKASKSTSAAAKAKTKAKVVTAEDPITGAEAIKLASKLTVQPEVYDVYLTSFVMQ